VIIAVKFSSKKPDRDHPFGHGRWEQIAALIRPLYDIDLQAHYFHIYNYVTHQVLIFHIKLANSTSIEAGHKIATDIENKIHQ